MLNINDLTKRKRERKLKRMENYSHILKQCHTKIINASNDRSDDNYIFYTIPNIVFGQPLIDTEECSLYIVEKLVKNGFQVKYLGKGFMFISWNHIVNPPKKKLLTLPKKKQVSFREPMLTPKKNNKGYRSIKDIPSTDTFLI